MRELLSETGRLRRDVASLGIPTEIADEYLMMAEAAGIATKQDLVEFKRESLLDIFSGSAAYTGTFISKVNTQSRVLAEGQQGVLADSILRSHKAEDTHAGGCGTSKAAAMASPAGMLK